MVSFRRVFRFLVKSGMFRRNGQPLQLNKANASHTAAPYLDLHIFIADDFVLSKTYNVDDVDFDTINVPFLDGDVLRRTFYRVYISQLIRFARSCSHVDDLSACNKCLTAKLL